MGPNGQVAGNAAAAGSLGRIAMSPGCQRPSMRAAVFLDQVGMVNTVVGAGAMRAMGEWAWTPGLRAQMRRGRPIV